MINPVLSIIIVSFNTKEITLNCLKSIKSDKKLQFDLSKINPDNKIPSEIIVIDNNSQDGSVPALKKLNYVKLIENKDNVGFGKANNQGLKISRGNYVLFLNSDTVILHSAISQSLDWLSSHPEASTCTAQLLNKDKTIQASGGFFPNILNVFTWSTGLDDLPLINQIIKPIHPHTPEFYTKDAFYTKDHPQDWVTGAFMLTRKSTLDKVGGFDEDFFMYAEELELSYRIHKIFPNYCVYYLVGPQVIHLGGASAISKAHPITNEYLGIISFFKKHKSRLEQSIVRILLKINASLRSIIYQLKGNLTTSHFYQEACSKI
ncbi:MAG: glycosyltransferase family 2 protein [Patescibacteria group bacterium]|jgi:GT2 family glycosyltransferase